MVKACNETLIGCNLIFFTESQTRKHTVKTLKQLFSTKKNFQNVSNKKYCICIGADGCSGRRAIKILKNL